MRKRGLPAGGTQPSGGQKIVTLEKREVAGPERVEEKKKVYQKKSPNLWKGRGGCARGGTKQTKKGKSRPACRKRGINKNGWPGVKHQKEKALV